MKVRTGFVSNSSSASFVVEQYYLSPQIIDWIENPKSAILRLREIYQQNYDDDYDFNEWLNDQVGDFEWASDWGVWKDDDGNMRGSCIVDNFNYFKFFQLLGITYSGS